MAEFQALEHWFQGIVWRYVDKTRERSDEPVQDTVFQLQESLSIGNETDLQVLRSKGLINVDGLFHILQAVREIYEFVPLSATTSIEDRMRLLQDCRIVLIGRNLDLASLPPLSSLLSLQSSWHFYIYPRWTYSLFEMLNGLCYNSADNKIQVGACEAYNFFTCRFRVSFSLSVHFIWRFLFPHDNHTRNAGENWYSVQMRIYSNGTR